MKLIRLPSGPLACVFPVEVETEHDKTSGVYRAFSGSVEADGPSEDQAIQALDAEVRRLSQPPPAEIAELEQLRSVANDVSRSERPGLASATARYPRVSEFDTLPAPASSS